MNEQEQSDKRIRVRDKATGKTMTLEEFAIELHKQSKRIIYTDIAGIAVIRARYSRTGRNQFYLLDECGNYVEIDTNRYEILGYDL